MKGIKLYNMLLLILALFSFSCSQRIFEAMEKQKLHDEYFILRKNGHYSIKILFMDMISMPDSERGRYVLAGDTVYFVNKLKGKKRIFETYAYGVIDTVAGKFYYRPGDPLKERIFSINKMLLRREEK